MQHSPRLVKKHPNILIAGLALALLGLTGCATAPASSSARAPSAESAEVSAAGTAAAAPTPVVQPTPIAATTPGPRAAAPSAGLTPLDAVVAAYTSSQPVAALAPPQDLWERIRRGFAMPDLQSDLVTDREQWYASRPDYIQRMTERSRKYLFHIVEELELRGMPTELALLPFIESAFNPQAVSSAKAAGMWQFIPSTGKYYDLKQNAFRDDRRDVLASTRAALDYLQKLHRMFGDWHLALAAYNWGEGSVQRSMQRNRRAGQDTAYTAINMPMETRLYVPKLQAVKNIVARPQSFNATLPLIENHPYFQTVPITRDIDVALAAKLAGVQLADFKALNPQLNRPVILAAGTPQILLPWDNATIFTDNLAAHGDERLASWTAWVVPTTLKPAEAARRVGMSESALRAANNIPARMLIKAGSALLVPRTAAANKDVAEHLADNGQVALAPEVHLRRRVARAGKADTVSSMARRLGVSAANLASWNNLSLSTALAPGRSLVFYTPASAPRSKQPQRATPRTLKR